MYGPKAKSEVKETIMKFAKAGTWTVEKAVAAISWETLLKKEKVQSIVEDAILLGIIKIEAGIIKKPKRIKDKSLDIYFKQQQNINSS